MDSWDTGAARLREVQAEDGDVLCNTDLLLPDLFHITFALDRFELEGRKLRKRLGAVVYTALPKPQVTLPSSARQSQDVMPVSHHWGPSALSCMHTLLRGVPLDRRGKASLERHRNTLKTFQVIKAPLCKSLGTDYSSQGNFYFCLDYPKALIMLNWLRGQSLTCVPSASHHGIPPARLTPDRAEPPELLKHFAQYLVVAVLLRAHEISASTAVLCPLQRLQMTCYRTARFARSCLPSLRWGSALRWCPQLLLSNDAPYQKKNILAHYKVFCTWWGTVRETHRVNALQREECVFSSASGV